MPPPDDRRHGHRPRGERAPPSRTSAPAPTGTTPSHQERGPMPTPGTTTSGPPPPGDASPPSHLMSAAVSTANGFALHVEHDARRRAAREQLEDEARASDAFAQFIRCFP